MTLGHEIALSVYTRTLARMAARAGTTYPQPADDPHGQLIDRAEAMALPEVQAESTAAPVMTSALGRILGETRTRYYRPAPLTVARDTVIPHAAPPDDPHGDYRALWQALEAEHNRVSRDARPALREAGLHALLQRFAWAIPAPGVEDVSLYDFARTSAALAVCLAEAPDDPDVAVLVGADLSGVQDWLYTLASDGAAKSLRGRSVYLQLLMEVIALDLLHTLELPMANLLYVGGGNFYMIVPRRLVDRVSEYHVTAGRRLLAMHEGSLYLALASAQLDAHDLHTSNVGAVWGHVAERLNQQKARRFVELGDATMAQVIGAGLQGTGIPEHTCLVCKRAMTADEAQEAGAVPEDADAAATGGIKCLLCRSFEDLGRALSTADYLTIARVAPERAERVLSWQSGLCQFGADVQFKKDAYRIGRQDTPWHKPESDFVHIHFWQDNADVAEFPGSPDPAHTVWAMRPLAQAAPLHESRQGNAKVASFEEFHSEGIQLWGVLRMDVDNLGTIFQTGITPGSLARAVSLSALMRLFFEGYLPTIVQRYNESTPCLQLMYAGGDDLFIVGGWSWLPTVAAEIRAEFDAFACGNPRVSLSGGIALALGAKYPLYQAAADAEDAEHQAKSYNPLHTVTAEKNALYFLGQAMSWQTHRGTDERLDSYARVRSRVDQLREWMPDQGPDRLPRSFLMSLRAIDAEWREWKKREQGEKAKFGRPPRYQHADAGLYLGPWLWHMVYSLNRAAERTQSREIREDVAMWIDGIISGQIVTLGLVARWAELVTRPDNRQREEHVNANKRERNT